MNYNYFEEMKQDIRKYIDENIDKENLTEELENGVNGAFDMLYDDMFVADEITGNASGSYTFNSYTARNYVLDNMDLLNEALTEFCEPADVITDKFLNENWEYFDITIRCYMLGQALTEVLEEIEEEIEEGSEQ